MDDTKICSNCNKQPELDLAHCDLKLISSIPESSIYRCDCGSAFWMLDRDGWENLDFDILWSMAS
jgi:hypothetical protein